MHWRIVEKELNSFFSERLIPTKNYQNEKVYSVRDSRECTYAHTDFHTHIPTQTCIYVCAHTYKHAHVLDWTSIYFLPWEDIIIAQHDIISVF